ncbi:unnamed protein product [Closterium sp. Naga37s-1]|nr:unnamed protein product [Closterium sp. Naga37s-1]
MVNMSLEVESHNYNPAIYGFVTEELLKPRWWGQTTDEAKAAEHKAKFHSSLRSWMFMKHTWLRMTNWLVPSSPWRIWCTCLALTGFGRWVLLISLHHGRM